jgi:beta-glucosidase
MNRDFFWGTSSVAYKIEGGIDQLGKKESIWDIFSHKEGYIEDGTNGDQAADSYHRFREDVSLMKELGVNEYAFTLSWTRIVPDGLTQINQVGLNFYSMLIDALLEAGIKPVISLYGFDLPYTLAAEGGFLSPESVKRFAFYADVVTKAYGNRVKDWIPFVAPEITIGACLQDGIFPPSLKLQPNILSIGIKMTFLCQAEAVRIIRQNVKDSKIWIDAYINGAIPFRPAMESDIELAKKKTFDLLSTRLASSPSLYLDPVLLKSMPKNVRALLKLTDDKEYNDFIKKISFSPDYLSLIIFSADTFKSGDPDKDSQSPFINRKPDNVPASLYWTSKFFYERYQIPVCIAGTGFFDKPSDFCSLIQDNSRVEFLGKCLKSVERALEEGIPLKGFSYNTLLDGFEWRKGFSVKGGLVAVDTADFTRTPKDSYHFFQDYLKDKNHQSEK